jgi:hypothetical protein
MIETIIDYGSVKTNPLARCTFVSTLSSAGHQKGVTISDCFTIDYDDPVLLEIAKALKQRLGEDEFTMILFGENNAIVVIDDRVNKL